MKISLSFLSSTFFCIAFNTIAQNLVPDPGFEIVRKMPSKENNSIYCTKDWMSPIGDGGADYYNKSGTRHAGVPKNIFGKQKPHSGNAYGGVCIRTKFMEYVETKLLDTLIKDQDYLVEFYISRAERSIGSVKEFGVLFTKKITMGINGVGIPAEPSVDFQKKKGYKNKKKWTQCSAVYRAKGYETALTIGYFNYKRAEHFKGFSHYYIDDVTVTLIKKKDDVFVSSNVTDSIPKTFSPKLGETIVLKNIFFNTNKSELLVESFSELDKLVDYLNDAQHTSIEITGHTDKTGNETINKILSEARAKAVADYLILKGINKLRITYKGYGSSHPIATNDTEEGKQQNRRVEFVVNKK